jgi:hypothetical protein
MPPFPSGSRSDCIDAGVTTTRMREVDRVRNKQSKATHGTIAESGARDGKLKISMKFR